MPSNEENLNTANTQNEGYFSRFRKWGSGSSKEADSNSRTVQNGKSSPCTADSVKIVEHDGDTFVVIRLNNLKPEIKEFDKKEGLFSRVGGNTLNFWKKSGVQNDRKTTPHEDPKKVTDKRGTGVVKSEGSLTTSKSYYNNVNPNIPKLKSVSMDAYDPEAPIEGGKDTSARIPNFTKIPSYIGKTLFSVTIGKDIHNTVCSVSEDYEKGTSRNTAECATEIAGSFAGGTIGAAGGASLGTLVLPGIGTITGGLIGSIVGGFSAGRGSSAAAKTVFDKLDYNIAYFKCNRCFLRFDVKLYKNSNTACPRCRCSQISACSGTEASEAQEFIYPIFCFDCNKILMDNQLDLEETKCLVCGKADLGLCI